MAFRTAPDPAQTGWPKGIPYIIGNEACERFSYYGMRSILYLYLVLLIQQTKGIGEDAADTEATIAYHLFVASVYALPMVGAVVSDRLLGKYNTILWVSLLYCAGHAVLSLSEGSLQGTYVGLGLIALGAGGIKPCVSAHVGDQFGRGNWGQLDKAFFAFYWAINMGAVLSMVFIPWVRVTWGYSVAFAIPGVLMGIATFVFWLGRNVFVHVPARPAGKLGLYDALSSSLLFMGVGSLFFTAGAHWSVQVSVALACLALGLAVFGARQRIEADDGFLAVLLYTLRVRLTGQEMQPLPAASAQTDARAKGFFGPAIRRFGPEAAEGPIAVMAILTIFALVPPFFSLFDQTGSSWVKQAEAMDRTFDLASWGVRTLPAEQAQAFNPVFVLILIPLLASVVFPLMERAGLRVTPLRRMGAGMFVAVFAFVAIAVLQVRLEAGQSVHVLWQALPYFIVTLAELLVSVTGLEFAYSQAPRRMKSTIMGFWMLTFTVGNLIVALVYSTSEALGELIFGRGQELSLSHLFWMFAALMLVTGVLFSIRATFYRYREYPQ